MATTTRPAAQPAVFVLLWLAWAAVIGLAIAVGRAVVETGVGATALQSARELALAAAGSAVLVGGATLATNLLGLALRRDVRPWLVGVAVWAAMLAAIDLYALRQANQGLSTIWGLWRAEGGAGLNAALEASGVGVGVVVLALALPMVVGGLSARASRWSRLSSPSLPRDLRGRLLAPLLAVGLGIAAMALLDPQAQVPRLVGRLLGPSRRWLAALPPDGEPLRVSLRPPLPHIERSAPPPQIERSAPPPTSSPQLADDAPQLIVLVIVESLRADAVEAEAMPRLTQLARDGEHHRRVVSAANATHPGWYTLLFGRWPHLWHRLRAGALAADGAVPLRLLHEAGYAISAYSGAGLDYYGIADRAFGLAGPRPIPLAAMVDARDAFAAGHVTRPAADRFAIDAAVRALQAKDAAPRRLLLVWLDGSHFPYAWPGSEADAQGAQGAKFRPFSDEATLRMGRLGDAGAAGLRNRYRNALVAIDVELGRLFDAAAAAAPGQAAILVTGDHGEELFEHGKFAHDSELCDVQLRVPLVMRWPGRAARVDDHLASQVDIMPTILDRVGLGPQAHAALDGRSLDAERVGEAAQRRAWVEVVATSAGSPAVAAIVLDAPGAVGDAPLGSRLEVAFSDREDVIASDALHLLRIADADGRGVVRRFDDPPRSRATPEAGESLLPFAPALWTLFGATLLAEAGPSVAATAAAVDLAGWNAPGDSVVLPKAATAVTLDVEVRNAGTRVWLQDVRIGWHWLNEQGAVLAVPERRALLPRDVAPGQSVRVALTLQPPSGAAALRLDLVRENVAWFRDLGSPVRIVRLR